MEIKLHVDCCVFCGTPAIPGITCSCKQAQKMQKSFEKPISGSLTTYKCLGSCPKCKMPISVQDINSKLMIVCPSCFNSASYEDIKKGIWK
jgi:hypothetical protein